METDTCIFYNKYLLKLVTDNGNVFPYKKESINNFFDN